MTTDHTQSCNRCGSVDIYHGTDDDWNNRSIVWADTHPCAGDA